MCQFAVQKHFVLLISQQVTTVKLRNEVRQTDALSQGGLELFKNVLEVTWSVSKKGVDH